MIQRRSGSAVPEARCLSVLPICATLEDDNVRLGAIFSLILFSQCGNLAADVTNGGFETGSFFGWTTSGNLIFTGVDTDSAHTGLFGAFFGPSVSVGPAFLSQMMLTQPGQAYDVSFWLANTGSAPNSFSFSWDGTVLNGILDQSPFPFQEYTFLGLLAASNATELTFSFANDPGFFFLDDVVVSDAVPEPSEVLPVLLCLSLMGFVRSRLASAWHRR